MISFPIETHAYLPDPGSKTSPLFESIVQWFGDRILGIEQFNHQLLSDSTGLYIHVLLLCILAMISTTIWTIVSKKKEHESLLYFFMVMVRYYLALQMIRYGMNKIFKYQFFLPEPNTLYTKLGDVPRDLLYWSALGTSRSYNVFMGLTELIAAFLLLFRRTQLVGGLVSFGILVNIVSVNFSFDISVKLFSSFLLLLSVIVIAPHLKRLWYFFILRESTTQRAWIIVYHSAFQYRMYMWVKAVVIFILFADSIQPYVNTGCFNDDAGPRIYLHGAYDVVSFERNSVSLQPCDPGRWTRVFVHREGYIIIQHLDESMQDIAMKTDPGTRKIMLTDYENKKHEMNYLQYDNVLELTGVFYGDTLKVKLLSLNWKKLPLLQNEFHWAIE